MSKWVSYLADASSIIKGGADKACAKNCGPADLNAIFANITNTLIFLVGAISVIMIIVGGLRYVLSNGDAKQTTSAKDTIFYAVIGVVVAIISYAIVQFVVKSIA